MVDATFADAHVQLGFGDPGGLSPLTGGAQNPVTDLWYDLLPAVYRDADGEDDSTEGGWPLYGFMDAVASVLAAPAVTAGRIAAGQFTDPALADDTWIPWLAQAAGVAGIGIADQRARLARLVSAPALGSRDRLAVLAQTFLTGTQSVTVTAAEPWGIQVQVRTDELSLVTDTAGLTAALYATGQIPTGYELSCLAVSETWGQVATALPTWAPGEGSTWARIGSMGLAGAGFAVGGFTYTGSAAGVTPP